MADRRPESTKPQGSGWFSLGVGVILIIAAAMYFVTPITFLAEDVLPAWLIVSGLIMIVWGANRLYNVFFKTNTILVGQDTINMVTAILAITFTIAAIIIEK
jgi:hypothetical protein